MGTSLIGLLPQNTYSGLIKVGNNTALNTTLKTLSDGAGNDLPMQASTTAINFTGTVSGVASGIAGAIQFSNGSAFASDASNFFWDNTTKRLGIGTNAPSATTHIQGSGSTIATTSLLIQNSAGTNMLNISDGGGIGIFTSRIFDGGNYDKAFYFDGNTAVASNFLSVSLRVFDGTAYASGLEVVGGAAESRVGIGTTSPNVSAKLQLDSTTKGFLPPRMTTTQRDAIATPATGLKVYNTTTNTTDTYDGTTWQRFGQQTLIKGSGSTSATTSLLVQNSAGTELFKIADNGNVSFDATHYINSSNIYGNFYQINDWIIRGGFTNDSGSIQIKTETNFGGNTNNNTSAYLQIDSISKGFLPPRMTTTQKNNISSPAAGLEMYDSTAKSPAYYDGTNWGYTGGALQNAAGNSGTLNISFAAGNIVNLTLNATTILAFSNAVIGTYIIQVTQGATGANSLAYPASVKWAGGTPPTLTTTVGKTDILTFYYDGTFYYGTYSLNY